MKWTLFACAVGVTAIGGAARADIVPIGESRRVSTMARVGTSQDGPRGSTAAFGAPFNASVNASITGETSNASGSAVQISTIAPREIRAQGSASSSVLGDGTLATSSGLSVFEVTFDVTPGTAFQLSGSISGIAALDLWDGSNVLLFSGSGTFNRTFDATTRLHLQATASSWVQSAPGSSACGYSLVITAVPGPGCAGALAGLALVMRRRR